MKTTNVGLKRWRYSDPCPGKPIFAGFAFKTKRNNILKDLYRGAVMKLCSPQTVNEVHFRSPSSKVEQIRHQTLPTIRLGSCAQLGLKAPASCVLLVFTFAVTHSCGNPQAVPANTRGSSVHRPFAKQPLRKTITTKIICVTSTAKQSMDKYLDKALLFIACTLK